MPHPTRDAKYQNGAWGLVNLLGGMMIRAIVTYVGVEERNSTIERIILNQNTPNPAIGNTLISYMLPERTKVNLEIYDITGRLISTLVDGIRAEGVNEVVWDRKDITGKRADIGIYFYKLRAGNFTTTKKRILL